MTDEKQVDCTHHHPAYHFVPQRGWMGDPNGIVFYQGRYHIFYQHNPDGFGFGNPNWARMDKVPWGPWPLATSRSP